MVVLGNLKYIGWQGIETVGGNNMRDCMAAGDYSSNSSYHNSVQRINNEQKSLVVIHETAWQTSVPLVHDNWANISPRKFKKTKIHKIKPQIKSAKINQTKTTENYNIFLQVTTGACQISL